MSYFLYLPFVVFLNILFPALLGILGFDEKIYLKEIKIKIILPTVQW